MLSRLLREKRRPRRGAPTSTVKFFPPPIKGWNARDPLPSMKPEHAIVLDNIIPHAERVVSRKGYSAHVTGLPAYPESLMSYAAPSAKMFAATPTAIYNVTTAGAVGAAVQSGLTSGRWQHTQFAATGASVLFMVNGADAPRYTDGTTWTSPALTGPTSVNALINICSHMSRLWFVEANTLDAWYGGTAALSGVLTKFPLGPLCRRGGHLMAIGSWSVDGGAGAEDRLVFVTSEGECLVYAGTDPASASAWGLVGRYQIPRPLGRRCLVSTGADLGIITEAGVSLLSQLLPLGESSQETAQVSDLISGAWQTATNLYGTSFGWQVQEFPNEQLLIVNVPIAERVTAHQYVCNLDTGAWCRFKDLNAGAWCMHQGELYFAQHGGTICLYGADTDNGADITADWQGAFSTFKDPSIKALLGARPIMNAPAGYVPTIEARVDFDTTASTAAGGVVPTSGTLWDVGNWDTSEWGAEAVQTAQWQTISGEGTAISLIMRLTLRAELVLNQVDVLYEKGDIL